MKENYNNFDPIEFIKIIENLYDVVEIWDDNYKLIYVNAAVYNSLGVRPKQLIGKHIRNFRRRLLTGRLQCYLIFIQIKKPLYRRRRLSSVYGTKA